MKKLILFAVLSMAAAAQAAPAKYYISGVVKCDDQVVTEPNVAYCRSISGGDPAGLLYAINIKDPKRPVVEVEMDNLLKVDAIAHMKILDISDRAQRMGAECTSLLVENGVITWAWAQPLVNCLKPRTITPAQ